MLRACEFLHYLLLYSVLTFGALILLQWYCETDSSVCCEERSPVSGQAHDAGTGEGSQTCTREVNEFRHSLFWVYS